MIESSLPPTPVPARSSWHWSLLAVGLLLLDAAGAVVVPAWVVLFQVLAAACLVVFFFRVVPGRWRRWTRVPAALVATGILWVAYAAIAHLVREVPKADYADSRKNQCSTLLVGPVLRATRPHLSSHARYLSDTANDVCRLTRFARTMDRKPQRLCPDTNETWPRDCTTAWLRTFLVDPELTLPGKLLLLGVATVAASHEATRLDAVEETKRQGGFLASLYLFDLTMAVHASLGAHPQTGSYANDMVDQHLRVKKQMFEKELTMLRQLDAQLATLEQALGRSAVLREELARRRAAFNVLPK